MYSNFKVAVIGDVMLDVWVRGGVARLSPEAPVPVILNPKTEYSLGGAGNVAANIVSLGAGVSLHGGLAEDDCITGGLIRDAGITDCTVGVGRDMTEKRRIIADGQQICRIDIERTAPFGEAAATYLMNELQQGLVEDIAQDVSSTVAYNAFIIADYNKGVMTPPFIKSVMNLAREHDIPVMVDPKFQNFWDYNGATIFKPNWSEWQAFERSGHPVSELIYEHMIITKGADGLDVHSGDVFRDIYAYPVAVADTTGAGDTVMAVLTLEYLRTGDIFKSAELANYAGSLAVQKHGTAQLTVDDLMRVLPTPAFAG